MLKRSVSYTLKIILKLIEYYQVHGGMELLQLKLNPLFRVCLILYVLHLMLKRKVCWHSDPLSMIFFIYPKYSLVLLRASLM